MKYGLFSRIIGLCNSSVQNCQNLCPKFVPHTHTKALIDDDATGSAASSVVSDQLVQLHSLIDQTCFEFIDVSYFGVVNFLPQNTPDAVFC